MGLSNLTFPEATIQSPGGEFAVRALGLEDVSELVRSHGPAMKTAFDQFTGGATTEDELKDIQLTEQGVASFILPLLESAPTLCAEVIARAAGEPENVAIVKRLPFPVQVDALEQIAVLTFETAGGPKKFLETVVRLTKGTTELLNSLQA